MPVPEREGYHFDGWYIDPNNDESIILDTLEIEEDITLYAKWTDIDLSLSFELDEDSYFVNVCEGLKHY